MSDIIIHDYKVVSSGEEYYDIHVMDDRHIFDSGDISYRQRKYQSARLPFTLEEKIIIAFCEHMISKR